MAATTIRRLDLWLKGGFSVLLLFFFVGAEAAVCSSGCDLALASYYVWVGSNLTFIAQVLNSSIPSIRSYNSQISDQDSVLSGTSVLVPFSNCDCINGEYYAHVFQYSVNTGDTYYTLATEYYSNLTTTAWLESWNSYAPNNIPNNAVLNVTVNCSCGDININSAYGLFTTYPLRPGDSLSSVASYFNISAQLLQEYNLNTDFSSGSGLVVVPTKDNTGSYRGLSTSSGGGSSGISPGGIAGISIAVIAVVLLLPGSIYCLVNRRKKAKRAVLLRSASEHHSIYHELGSGSLKITIPPTVVGGVSPGVTPISVDKSVEFSYEELANATNSFSIASKIGEGGFGVVYYAELRGEKAAIKKMDMQASREFLAELKVLTHVHHLNLVRLIGYCIEGSLFLVYEFIENGNLSQHLRGSGNDPLPWSTRVQIALDSARGLEYIHEHTVPVYIHRDIKSANILIDKNYHGKVADFGLAKLTEVGNSLQTRLVGTFGYMPPEYAQYGDVSPKVDVFAFGVVLYELISAKEAVVKATGSIDTQGLVALFDHALSKPDPREDLRKLVDRRLGDDYPLDAVLKMAQLAEACTKENPQLRPSMRSIVVALMTLSSSTEEWDVRAFYGNQALVNLVSGR
ncbi:chitin elicitor receptor kinase 1-like [Macadamia integrifolia]|uniref:chitin elicitor receptor kinase 1-like n=1 Tax=Macadamia integrifolia TaxID=60698 RepID=UPI001C52EF1F|nr:chitin elicitor receptor kinase 1-like [Macadamia integrifolia]